MLYKSFANACNYCKVFTVDLDPDFVDKSYNDGDQGVGFYKKIYDYIDGIFSGTISTLSVGSISSTPTQ